ncbi:type II toxin-antitoxin system VapC family toxin [Leifsonia sp. NPDC058248]|uniref:type II toxin-antitoxin system VapC family toxin n=1 Tax=Leifsonia sp. NPDC058248 TaxID=3346402 RepID=UPI0036D8D916
MIAAVIDCSALVELLSNGGARATGWEGPLEDCMLAAPQLIEPELINAARRLVAHDNGYEKSAERLLYEYRQVQLTKFTHENLSEFAWRVRDNITPYDAMYVGLAREFEIPLITSDKRLAAAAAKWCEVRLLDDVVQGRRFSYAPTEY